MTVCTTDVFFSAGAKEETAVKVEMKKPLEKR